MYKYFLWICIWIWLPHCTVWAQLTSVSPSTAVQGQHLPTTITSNGFFLQASTPSGNIHSIILSNATDLIQLFEHSSFNTTDVTVLNSDSLAAIFRIPANAAPGLYDLIVETGDTLAGSSPSASYTLPASYIISVPDGFISGNAYDDLNKNGIKDAGELGLRLRTITCMPHGHELLTDINGDYSFPVANGNYNIVVGNNMWYAHMFPTTPGIIPVTVNNNNSTGNDFGLKDALISVTPDTGYRGVTTLHRLISEEPIFIPGTSAYGNVYSVNGYTSPNLNVYFNSNSIFVIDSFTVDVLMKIPANAVMADSIDIVVEIADTIPAYDTHKHLLRDKLTVVAAEGAISGKVFNDLNKNGIQDVGEPNMSNSKVKVGPANYTVTTNTSGEFFVPVQNGNYTLTVVPNSYIYLFTSSADTLYVTVNNDTVSGNDFGMASALTSITPDTAFQGITTTHIITSDKPVFIPGPQPFGNINNVLVLSSPSINVSVFNSVVVIDSFTVQLTINVPINTTLANNVDIRFYLNTGPVGYHYLFQKLNIAPPEGFVYGKVFFDQNQNKIRDSGEGTVSGMKVQLSPEMNFAFSDSAGNFQIASQGGQQVLTPAGNLSGLILNTDSTSYTFVASGTITGKDFGYISTNPNYTIDIQQLYIFPRCFTSQYATFRIRNTSNIPYDAVVWMKYDPLLNYQNATPSPSYISNDTIYWNLTGINPFVDVVFSVLFQIPGPGNTISLEAGTSSLDGSGAVQYSDAVSNTLMVLCSFDPNDKQVTPPGILSQNYTLMSDTLDYLIRFQNTGNDTAFKVVILDTLDSDLNLSTFEITGSSHSMQTQIYANGSVRFEFDNILLPDSNVNEPGSHGYIKYRIRAKSGLPNETVVTNTAHIFFDFNPAVITNSTLNTLVYVLPVGIEETENSLNAVLYPNPFSTTATLRFDNPGALTYSFFITDITGRQVQNIRQVKNNSLTIDASELSKGFYFYHLRNQNGNGHTGSFIIK